MSHIIHPSSHPSNSIISHIQPEQAKSKKFEDALSKGNFDRSVVLKMARSVGSEKMVDALAESLKPRLGGSNKDALDQFQNILLKGRSLLIYIYLTSLIWAI